MNRFVNLAQTSNQIVVYVNACLTTQNLVDVKLYIWEFHNVIPIMLPANVS